MKSKHKKLDIPASVKELRLSEKKFAKKHGIRLKGKGMRKKDRIRQEKKLHKEYSRAMIKGLNKAVRMMADHPEAKNIDKVKDGVENIIRNAKAMRRISRIYKKDRDAYPNMIFLPGMIMNTILYYSQEDLSEEDKAIADAIDKDQLIEFCERILSKEIKRYKKLGLDEAVAYQLATVIPTAKLFTRKESRIWYRRLIGSLYDIAEVHPVDVDTILAAICKVDKKNKISRREFLSGFFGEFIMQKATNKVAKFTETQKELHETLIDRCMVYLNGLKKKKLREILKQYIRRRKTAEEFKNDSRRVIKFTDHANSNSPYATIQEVVKDLIASNPSNELYLQ